MGDWGQISGRVPGQPARHASVDWRAAQQHLGSVRAPPEADPIGQLVESGADLRSWLACWVTANVFTSTAVDRAVVGALTAENIGGS